MAKYTKQQRVNTRRERDAAWPDVLRENPAATAVLAAAIPARDALVAAMAQRYPCEAEDVGWAWWQEDYRREFVSALNRGTGTQREGSPATAAGGPAPNPAVAALGLLLQAQFPTLLPAVRVALERADVPAATELLRLLPETG